MTSTFCCEMGSIYKGILMYTRVHYLKTKYLCNSLHSEQNWPLFHEIPFPIRRTTDGQTIIIQTWVFSQNEPSESAISRKTMDGIHCQ